MASPPSFDRMSALIEAAAGVVGETDLSQVLRRLVAEARSATGASYGALGVIGDHGVLSDFIYEGIGAEQALAIGHLPMGRGVLGAVIRLNKTIRLDRISDHPDTVGFPEHHPEMNSFLGVPVAVGATAFGNLYLTEKDSGFTDQDVVVVEALSRIAGSAIRTARLQERLRRVAVVEDRQRIARELHDSVIQEMFAVGLGLQGLSQIVESEQAEATLLDAVDRLDSAVETLRKYIFELRRDPEISLAFDTRLQQLVARMGGVYPTSVTLDHSLESSVSNVVEDELLAIVTEGLSNALRHSSAAKVNVSVRLTNTGHEIVISDDGHGFDPEQQTNGMGLENLRTRVKKMDGDIAITSSTTGTIVSVRLPA